MAPPPDVLWGGLLRVAHRPGRVRHADRGHTIASGEPRGRSEPRTSGRAGVPWTWCCRRARPGRVGPPTHREDAHGPIVSLAVGSWRSWPWSWETLQPPLASSSRSATTTRTRSGPTRIREQLSDLRCDGVVWAVEAPHCRHPSDERRLPCAHGDGRGGRFRSPTAPQSGVPWPRCAAPLDAARSRWGGSRGPSSNAGDAGRAHSDLRPASWIWRPRRARATDEVVENKAHQVRASVHRVHRGMMWALAADPCRASSFVASPSC